MKREPADLRRGAPDRSPSNVPATDQDEQLQDRREAVQLLAEAALPTRLGAFRIAVFQVCGEAAEIVALLRGPIGAQPMLVRLHSACLTSESLGSQRCDCREQLETSLERIAVEDRGVLLYLRQEGRGIGLVDKIRAYALQDAGLDTVDANLALGLPVDARDYTAAAAVLTFLGISQVRLLTNNPAKIAALEQCGLQVVERIPLEIQSRPSNAGYLQAKSLRMGHLLRAVNAQSSAEP